MSNLVWNDPLARVNPVPNPNPSCCRGEHICAKCKALAEVGAHVPSVNLGHGDDQFGGIAAGCAASAFRLAADPQTRTEVIAGLERLLSMVRGAGDADPTPATNTGTTMNLNTMTTEHLLAMAREVNEERHIRFGLELGTLTPPMVANSGHPRPFGSLSGEQLESLDRNIYDERCRRNIDETLPTFNVDLDEQASPSLRLGRLVVNPVVNAGKDESDNLLPTFDVDFTARANK